MRLQQWASTPEGPGAPLVFIAARLIALDKSPDVRLIGIGDTSRS